MSKLDLHDLVNVRGLSLNISLLYPQIPDSNLQELMDYTSRLHPISTPNELLIFLHAKIAYKAQFVIPFTATLSQIFVDHLCYLVYSGEPCDLVHDAESYLCNISAGILSTTSISDLNLYY